MEKGGSGAPVLPDIGDGLAGNSPMVAAFEQGTLFEGGERKTECCGLELGEAPRQRFGRTPAVKQFENLERERSCTHPLSGDIVFKKELSAGPIQYQVR